jgi:hypothetical protein
MAFVAIAPSKYAESAPSASAYLYWSRPADIVSASSAVGTLSFKFQSVHHLPLGTVITFSLPYIYLSSVAACTFGGGATAQGACVLSHVSLLTTNLVCTTSVSNISAGAVELILQAGTFSAGTGARAAATRGVATIAAPLVTRSGTYKVHASFLDLDSYGRGVFATYYKDFKFTSPRSVVAQSLVNCPATCAAQNAILVSDTVGAVFATGVKSAFSIRWAGVFRTTQTGNYIFHVGSSSGDSINFYVDNRNIISYTATSASDTKSGILNLGSVANSFFDIELEYQRSSFSSSGLVNVRVESVASNAIEGLGQYTFLPNYLPSMPNLVVFNPAATGNAACTITGMALSLATAGISSTFSLTTYDVYGNRRLMGGMPNVDYIDATLKQTNGAFASIGTTHVGAGIYMLSYAATASAQFTLSVNIDSSRTFTVNVNPGVPCASTSAVYGEALALATAANAATFFITVRDAFGNTRSVDDSRWYVTMSDNVSEFKNLKVVYHTASGRSDTYAVSYRLSKSGTFRIWASMADTYNISTSGLLGNYFVDCNLANLVMTRTDAVISFNWNTQSPVPSDNTGDVCFSVLWTGYIQPPTSGTYTFSVTLGGTDEQVRLWVDDRFIIDTWSPLVTTSVSLSGTVQLISNTLFDIKLQYRDSSVNNAAITLAWQGPSVASSTIPSTRLFTRLQPLKGSPFTVAASPAATCASTSTARGPGLSLATAGAAASFTITTYDHLGNLRTTTTDQFCVRVSPPAASGVAETTGTVISIAPGLYRAVYTATLKRNGRFTSPGTTTRHDVSVTLGSCAVAGSRLYIPVPDEPGLQATFYSTNALNSPHAFVEGVLLDWSQVGSQRYHRSMPSVSQFAAKWKGFVRPAMRGLYTFYFQTASADSAAILIESDSPTLPSLVTGAERSATFFVPSAHSLYSIAVFVTLNTASNSQLRLRWENMGLTFSSFRWSEPESTISLPKSIIPASALFAIRSLPTIVRDDSAVFYGGDAPVGCLSSSGATGTDAFIKYSNCFGPGTRTLDILHVDVRPAQVCAVTSAVLPGGLMFLTLTTAGVLSSFDLVLKDQFGNIRDNHDDVVAVALAVRPSGQYFSTGAKSIYPTYAYATLGDPSGRYTVEYRVTYAGQYWMTVSAGDSSNTGLIAQ